MDTQLFNESSNSYLEDGEAHPSKEGSEIPTLEEVLARFEGRLRFNVELKGTDSRLGPAVIALADRYPDTIVRISSFAWEVPPQVVERYRMEGPESLSPDTLNLVATPNGNYKTDLLSPVASMTKGIEVALLYTGYELPPLRTMVWTAKAYGAAWLHLPYGFNLSSEDRPLEDPDDVLDKECDGRTMRSIIDCFPVSTRSRLPTRDVVLQETLNLRHAVKVFRNQGLRVLVYGGREHELRQRLELVLRCDVDGLCPNDGALALQLLREKRGDG